MVGPSNYEKWFYWQSSTAEQTKRNNIKYELENLLRSNPVIKLFLYCICNLMLILIPHYCI